MNYPIVAEQTLETVQPRWWSRRRECVDVPALPPGAVYVFRVGGQYREYPEGVSFDPSHPDVVEAASVSLVDTRTRLVEVERTVPSVSEADVFTIRASFTCQVTDAAVVARQGIDDVTIPLRSYLARDGELSRGSAAHRIEEVNAVRDQVNLRMTAYTTIVAPRVAGMSVEYVGIEVLTPDDLRAWEQKLRDERRGQELLRGQHEFESQAVQQLAELLAQGGVYADALGVTRNRIDVAAIAERAHRLDELDKTRRHQAGAEEKSHAREREAEDRKMRAHLIDTLLKQMGTSQEYVDFQQLFQQVSEYGAAPAKGSPAPAVESGPHREHGPARKLTGRGGREPHPSFIKDEDDLLD
ncbi:hypothetical protein EYS09_16210 [Streptomyces kasugaensis]|uniref:SPFH domain-containing protein n=1 Tax=Streptomyces kasugaensis TaxID=1946 RepID=A0A4Q9HUX8_STRKA|nr:hypothetical protein [Streptomyces sp. SID7805]TBO58665.1 hypothetical protein EYS09_16210 [Streptomyces kasugaensis]